MTPTFTDMDPHGTREWLDALQSVMDFEGTEKAHYLLEQMIDMARQKGMDLAYSAETPYINTIAVEQQPPLPPQQDIEHRLRSLVRWNAMAMVVKANRREGEVGGHIASFASSATLYEVAFNHFFKGNDRPDSNGGDLVFFQGHASPGMYARAFLEGRITEEQLTNFRREVDGKGVSSYPHPWLMPGFWQFPTVSMGLGPLMAIYQARFMKYLENRGLIKKEDRRVYAYLGDGEMDEPESQGAIALAARENLDNLCFIVNCNLQRLDGPVRGNGKIIQELERNFRGAGWQVLKVIWGSEWDALLAKDTSGMLKKRMMEVVDGDYQAYKAKGGAYVREHFFGKYPETAALVKDMSDEDIWRLSRGGHDPRKVYAAYKKAEETKGQPTVILAKTVKGYGMGGDGEGANNAHQQKKMGEVSLRGFRDRFGIPVSDEQLNDLPFYKPSDDAPEIKYLLERRAALGGQMPARKETEERLTAPALSAFDALLKDTGEREMSTTMVFVRILAILLRDKNIKDRLVPIIPDEARTFGMEGLFRQVGIYSPLGQNYTPVDSDQMMWYKESIDGQILEEGINEAGSMSSWLAAATSYANHNINMVPFYIYYSMFGFQRIGDLAWAAGDLRAKGFLVGGTAGRTTLNGEGLQHQDGHHHLIASTIPNCKAYDPTFAYELAVIIRDGLERMYEKNEKCFYYISVMNENYAHPEMPQGCEEGIIKGIYKFKEVAGQGEHVNLMGSGTILREVIAAADLLAADFGMASTLWSVPSFNELQRDGIETNRQNRMNPTAKNKAKAYITEALEGSTGPFIAATDYVRAYADQVREFVPGAYHVLGTDGFGRSDTRENLRRFFEVDRYYVAVEALSALAAQGKVPAKTVADAIKKYGLDVNKANPLTV
jgi:pyruvate dehydrogenase E1 component